RLCVWYISGRTVLRPTRRRYSANSIEPSVMPSILSSFTSQASFKLLTLGTGQYLPQINVIKSKIRLPSKLMKHMSEDGSTIIDARIIEPAEVEVQVLITPQDQFMALNNVLNDRGAFYTIITKGL